MYQTEYTTDGKGAVVALVTMTKAQHDELCEFARESLNVTPSTHEFCDKLIKTLKDRPTPKWTPGSHFSIPVLKRLELSQPVDYVVIKINEKDQ